MQRIRNASGWKNRQKPLALALGNFDGVHRGHQVLLQKMAATAKKKGWTSAVYTFDPHPAKILSPKTAPLLLQTPGQKWSALEALGIEAVIVETFDKNFAKTTPEDFFEKILVKQLGTRGLWVGYDFTFGAGRRGNTALLGKFCAEKGVALHVEEAQTQDDTPISSTEIRSLVSLGKIREAANLLGRPFALAGHVKKGMGLGAKLGLHTANLHVENELLPKRGIYATRTKIFETVRGGPGLPAGGRVEPRIWPSATSVGFNPTFPGKGFSVETHLIGFDGNLVGQKIGVEFLEWLREEKTFPDMPSLADQIRKDIAEAKRIYEQT